jgi:hypothetical protein
VLTKKAVRETDARPRNAIQKGNNRWYIFCPGCFDLSRKNSPENPHWWMLGALHCFDDTIHQFNGDTEKPTLSPSLLSTGSKRCHSFVTDGRIQFLSDCDHDLKNRTEDLMPTLLYTAMPPYAGTLSETGSFNGYQFGAREARWRILLYGPDDTRTAADIAEETRLYIPEEIRSLPSALAYAEGAERMAAVLKAAISSAPEPFGRIAEIPFEAVPERWTGE